MTSKMQIKIATLEELKVAVGWAAQEGWNPGVDDAESYFAADETGFLIGYLDDVPIATISTVKYGDDFAFIGFYIVKKAYRGQGYGWQIWQAAMQGLAGRNVALDGVVEQQANYQKSGFELAYRNIRFQFSAYAVKQSVPDIVSLDSVDLAKVLDYDRAFFASDRRQFMQRWLTEQQHHSLVYQSNGSIQGVGVIRPCQNGYKIGPLFADTAEIAEQLCIALQNKVVQGFDVFLDVPEVNGQAMMLVEKLAMVKVFETARMYTKTQPEVSVDRTYGVTSFEIG